jgi:hypothetical protein
LGIEFGHNKQRRGSQVAQGGGLQNHYSWVRLPPAPPKNQLPNRKQKSRNALSGPHCYTSSVIRRSALDTYQSVATPLLRRPHPQVILPPLRAGAAGTIATAASSCRNGVQRMCSLNGSLSPRSHQRIQKGVPFFLNFIANEVPMPAWQAAGTHTARSPSAT